MSVIGQFRDLDDPDSFVWLRGFNDMPSRAAALNLFYTGPVWAAHRDEANSTMINSDNVLLLRPAPPDAGFASLHAARPAPGAEEYSAVLWLRRSVISHHAQKTSLPGSSRPLSSHI